MKSTEDSLVEAISKSFCTALAVLGDPALAETLVSEALDAVNLLTGKALRDSVVQRLVQLQLAEACEVCCAS